MVFLKMSRRFYIETFGCQMNVHDSEKMAGVLSGEGYRPTDDPKEADIIIYNTCSIREKAEQKFFSELGRIKPLKRKRPHLKIAVAGCIAQQKGKAVFARAPHVDLVLGPQNIHLLGGLVRNDRGRAVANEDNPFIAESDLPVLRKPGGRAWVSIMYGCNNYCSYCIVPFTRGRERSRPSGSVAQEIAGLAVQGFKEVTLLGQNVNSYRSDLDFPGLLRAINAIDGIERVRFVTSHPRDLSEDLISAMSGLEKVCEHLHLPLQSGSDKVLKQMNRGYSLAEYRRKVDALRERVSGLSLTTDIITGFPGETDRDHRSTIEALEEIRYDGIFAFKYSPRPGTSAALMGDPVHDTSKTGRIEEILALQDAITLGINRGLENTVQEILVEGPSETDASMATGRTRTNKVVNFPAVSVRPGDTVQVRITSARKHSLIGRLCEGLHT